MPDGKDKKEKSTVENETKNITSENNDLYPNNENIASKNAESNYYTPFGD